MKNFDEYKKLNERFNDLAVLRNLYNFFKRKYGEDDSKFVEVALGLVKSGDIYAYSLQNFLDEIGYELTPNQQRELTPPKPSFSGGSCGSSPASNAQKKKIVDPCSHGSFSSRGC